MTRRRALWRSRGGKPSWGKQLGRGRGCGGQGAESPGDTRLPGLGLSAPGGGPSGSGAGRGVVNMCVGAGITHPGVCPEAAEAQAASWLGKTLLPARGCPSAVPSPPEEARLALPPQLTQLPALEAPPRGGGRKNQAAPRSQGLSGSDLDPLGCPSWGAPATGRVLCPGLQRSQGSRSEALGSGTL